MNFVGPYVNDRATMNVSAAGDTGASFSVEWPSSAAEVSTWTMSGTFNAETGTVIYEDCTKTTVTYGEDGEVESEVVDYTGGTGQIVFSGNSLQWADDMEHVADGATFTFSA